jgi:2-C-methyl-D-erythritol 4-phosphate cytidylyltransferase
VLVERYSDHPVRMIRGDRSNFKITTPEDLEYGEFLLRGEQSGITD